MSYSEISGYGTNPEDISLGMLEEELSNQLWSWARADTVTLNGGLVESWTDRVALSGAVRPNARNIDASHAYTQPNALLRAVMTTLPVLNTREAVDFNIGPWYESTLPLPRWSFLNTGEGGGIYAIVVPKSTGGVKVIGGTEITGKGFLASINNSATPDSTLRLRIRKTASVVVIQLDTSPGGVVVNFPSLCKFSYKEGVVPQEAQVSGGGFSVSGISTSAPVVENPDNTWRLGMRPNTPTTELDAYVADFMVVSVVSPYIDSLISLYANLRYGF